ncbi:MAG TPA: hypothetical protein VGM37_05705 [Armatimonadota bacterium]|jgi:hypothetical protein
MGALWGLAELAAFIVFVVGLVRGRGFFTALKMGIGVLILGAVAVVALGLLAVGLAIAVRLLILAIWLALIVGLVSVVGRVVKGAA